MTAPELVIEHPNRKTRAARVTRALVVTLLLASAGIVLVVAAGGWDQLEVTRGVTIAVAVLDVVLAVLVARRQRGVLPVAAAVAVAVATFGAAAGPAWFERDQPGFADSALDPTVLGLLCLLLVPVGLLLAALALSGFRQAWHVAMEVGGPRAVSEASRRAVA